MNVTKQGDHYFATRDGEPSVYELESKSVDELEKAVAAVKPYTAPKGGSKK